MTWRGIVGKGFTAAEFEQYVHTVKLGAWRPKFVVVHNTSAPSLALYATWQKRKGWSGEQWLRNLEGYYQGQRPPWSAGPHLFVAPDKIWAFTPINIQGTHSPSWNDRSIGVETVGEFQTESFDDGVRDNLIAALATLHKLFGLDPANYKVNEHGLHLHKEDTGFNGHKGTTHTSCPGKHIVKADLVAAVVAKMHGAAIPQPAPVTKPPPDTSDHPVDRPANPAPKPDPTTRVANYMPWILEDEGGFAIKATEPGGAVNMGVSMETFQAWRHTHGQPVPTIDDLRRIDKVEVAAIYDAMYYRPIRGPELPLGIDYCVLDSAINDGVGGSIRLMQQTLGVGVDGVLGDETKKAALKADPATFIPQFCANRLAYKKTRSGWPKNGPGWTNRINRVQPRSLKLAGVA